MRFGGYDNDSFSGPANAYGCWAWGGDHWENEQDCWAERLWDSLQHDEYGDPVVLPHVECEGQGALF